MLYEKIVLKTFAIFTGKDLCWILFLKSFLKRASNTGAFCECREIFKNAYFEIEIEIWLRTHIRKFEDLIRKQGIVVNPRSDKEASVDWKSRVKNEYFEIILHYFFGWLIYPWL